jgi:hypothetical protein
MNLMSVMQRSTGEYLLKIYSSESSKSCRGIQDNVRVERSVDRRSTEHRLSQELATSPKICIPYYPAALLYEIFKRHLLPHNLTLADDAWVPCISYV